jgi:hypothetical protein
MTESTMPRSATISSWLGKFAPSCALAGIAGIHLGLVPPIGGYLIYMIGMLTALLAIGFSIVGFLINRADLSDRARTSYWIALASGTIMLTITLAVAFASPNMGAAPPINDISTDLEDPPEFASSSDVPDFEGRDMSYPPSFVPIVRANYPDLRTFRTSGSPDAVFDKAVATAEGLGWDVVYRSPDTGSFDARESSALFKFVDDVTVRVRAGGDGQILIDVRSKSRDGRGDLGVNARRIRAFSEAFGD